MSDLIFDLKIPRHRIAQVPVSPRDRSRLLVLWRAPGQIAHRLFTDLSEILRPGDALVRNISRVFPCRLRGRKPTGGKVEFLLLHRLDASKGLRWSALIRGSRGDGRVAFPDGLEAEIGDRRGDGSFEVFFSRDSLFAYLERYGEMPLPPYIRRRTPQRRDRTRYQTVFARELGSIAAPTAGLHFSHSLLKRLKEKGVHLVDVVLHVGWGTFRPIRTGDIRQHRMLPEHYEVSSETAETLNQVRSWGGRIVAVGTTTVRALETVVDDHGRFRLQSGESSLYIVPGFRFRAVDALLTNFHLPRSTPLALACAFAGTQLLQKVYRAALRKRYRFYSYGDACLIF